MSEETGNELTINVKGPSELKLQIAITSDKTVLELKQAIAAKSDVEADRQRLIYSGRVLKDDDALSVYKIQSSHTIHMVKGVARSAASTTSTAPSQPLPAMSAGQSPLDPLTALNTPAGFGALAGANPFASMGLNPNDPNMLQGMMDNPAFLQQMSSVMSNPQVLDQIISQNPQLAAMGPQVREVFQSDRFRELMSNPESLRTMLQMSSMMQGINGPGGAGGGATPFPAPGLPSNAAPTPAPTGTQTTPSAAPAFPPLGNMFGGAAGAGAGAPGGMFDPAMLQQMQSLFGAGGGAGGFGGGAGGFGGAPAAPADTRPPEERFELQIRQLNDMGFTNPVQNIRALQATAGNVHSAIEYILGGGGL
ncbi:hypothetical protein HWV62_14838 [Athelia sp. TMB]|nr:hypothetical protein HWV62_14838 [Athelia sp. TMB]